MKGPAVIPHDNDLQRARFTLFDGVLVLLGVGFFLAVFLLGY